LTGGRYMVDLKITEIDGNLKQLALLEFLAAKGE
jgi:hypothetical protein